MSNINLLPWREEKIFHKNNIFYFLCVIVAIISIILTLIANVWMQYLIANQNKDISFLGKEVSVYQEKIKEINGLKERKEMILSRAEIINSLQAKRGYAIKVLEGLIRSVPDGVVFEKVDMKNNNLNISGRGDSTSRVSLFMRNLEEANIFSDPKLQEIKAPDSQSVDHGVSFVLQVRMME